MDHLQFKDKHGVALPSCRVERSWAMPQVCQAYCAVTVNTPGLWEDRRDLCPCMTLASRAALLASTDRILYNKEIYTDFNLIHVSLVLFVLTFLFYLKIQENLINLVFWYGKTTLKLSGLRHWSPRAFLWSDWAQAESFSSRMVHTVIREMQRPESSEGSTGVDIPEGWLPWPQADPG